MSNLNFKFKFKFKIDKVFNTDYYFCMKSKNLTKKSVDKRDATYKKYDRQTTRAIILETAGQVFAEYGYSMATSKEICQRAGVNSASVNYYFGGKEQLYHEVLIEAHSRMIHIDDLTAFFASKKEPKAMLKDYLDYVLKIVKNVSNDWSLKLIFHETNFPSDFGAKALENAIEPKKEKFIIFLHELTKLPINSAQMQSAVILVASFCAAMVNFATLMNKMTFSAQAINHDGYIDDMSNFLFGGLMALKEEYESKNR